MKVILDTNFLIYCAREKIDYVEEISKIMIEGYELVVPLQVIFELEELKNTCKKLSDRQAAKLALLLLEANKVRKIKIPGKTADQAITHLSKDNIVATHDFKLRRKLARSIVIKGKRKIDFY